MTLLRIFAYKKCAFKTWNCNQHLTDTLPCYQNEAHMCNSLHADMHSDVHHMKRKLNFAVFPKFFLENIDT